MKLFAKKKNVPQILAKEVWESYDMEYLKQDFLKRFNRYKVEANTTWGKEFNQTLEQLTNDLTLEEEVYLVEALFKNRPDYFVAEELNLSNDNLQNVKNSCLIKVWNEFHISNKLGVSVK